MATDVPSFEDWVAYCFEHGYADLQAYSGAKGEEFAAIEAREERFESIPNSTLTEYAIRLFSAPAFIADRYSDKQIADATWFIFGVGSSYFHFFREVDVATDIQTKLMCSVPTMYTELFDRVCNKHAEDPDGNYVDALPVDIAVYMIWDMDSIEGPLYNQRDWPHLIDPSFEVLEAALFRCRTASCKRSALHGLGEVHHAHSKRVESIIDRFLSLRDQPEHLREYAKAARTGSVL